MKNRPEVLNLIYQNPDSLPRHYEDDEINFFDICRILIRHKKLILKSMLLFALLGFSYGMIKKPHYSVSTVLQIGSLHNDDKGIPVPIESTSDVAEKLKSAYIPFVLSDHQHNNSIQPSHYAIETSVPKQSNVITVKTGCVEDQESVCKSLIDGVVQKILDDHAIVAGLTRKKIEVKLTSLQNALNSSREEIKFINAKKQRLKQTAELLTIQLDEKKAMLESARKNRGRITASNATGAMLALQIDNEIKRNQELVDALEQRLTIGINQEHDDLDKAEKANLRAQNDQENVIAQVKNELLNINGTRAIVPTLMSTKPTGLSTPMLVVLSCLAGLCVGIVAALLLKLMEKTKELELAKVAA